MVQVIESRYLGFKIIDLVICSDRGLGLLIKPICKKVF